MLPGSTSKCSESVVASATTIAPKSDLVRLTGAVQIETIIPPYSGFSGVMFLVAVDGAIVLGTAGNILVGQSLAQNRLYMLVYSKLAAKWYIHGVA